MKRQSDECRNKAENKHEGHRASGSQPQVEMVRPRGKDGPAKMATHCIIVGCKGRQRENWETEDLMTDTFQEGTDHKQQKPGANGEDKHNNLTNNVTYCADICRKWLHRCIY